MSALAAPSLTKKLGIVDDAVFTVIGAPRGFAELLGDYGDAVWQRNLMPPIDVIVAFFTERATMRAKWPDLTEAASPAGGIWVAWPKASSAVATDLNDNAVRADLLKTGWVDNKVCAIDDTWTALRFVMRKDERPPWKR
ncbi:MAG: DUF3052 domain-containing protein [Actinomycetota bacterium]